MKKINKYTNWILGLCICCFCSFGTLAQNWPNALVIDDPTILNSLDSSQFQILEDNNFNLNQAIALGKQGAFKPLLFNTPESRSTGQWYRFKIQNKTNQTIHFFINTYRASFSTVYESKNGIKGWITKKSGNKCPESEMDNSGGSKERYRIFVAIDSGQTVYIYQHLKVNFWEKRIGFVTPRLQLENERVNDYFQEMKVDEGWKHYLLDGLMIGIFLFGIFYNFIIFGFTRDKVYLFFGIFLVFLMLDCRQESILYGFIKENVGVYTFVSNFFYLLFHIFFFKAIMKYIGYIPDTHKRYKTINIGLFLLVLLTVIRLFSYQYSDNVGNILILIFETVRLTLMSIVSVMLLKLIRRGHKNLKVILLAFFPYFLYNFLTSTAMLLEWQLGINLIEQENSNYFDIIESSTLAWLVITFSAALVGRYQEIRKKIVQDELDKQEAEKERELEKSRLIEQQKIDLEKQVQARTAELKLSLENLKIAQEQLVQSEKLASLGELTAGIAHEIQNPLNFVNNFAELNQELLGELEEEVNKEKIEKGTLLPLIEDLRQNESKIDFHGKRAASIVKGMLQHSRNNSSEKEMVDLNQLADEYLRLAYHGLRAKNKSFNADFELISDPHLEKILIAPQEIGRVLLNIFNNAFHAVEKVEGKKLVKVAIESNAQKVKVKIKDTGTGMTEATKNKIFQPFFTTKPTGEGTGLGLSMAYDIITKGHSGNITVESTPGQGSEFTIEIPKTKTT